MNLIDKAEEYMNKAYAPYSKFRVGCVVVMRSGATFGGCNVENASYSATICAERVAIGSAIASGEKEIKEVYLINSSERLCMPCGVCLQFISEFGKDVEVISTDGKKKTTERRKLKELLPFIYDKSYLKL